ncbi:hypothetical protein [Acidiferrobacter sp.]|uniref:hypothetical protein n=1 Tax=Acidiferrobacter sp. TaxID=1872107 RepID=UPI0026321FD7|nr:hypothetical protein [Acidiferrobacter sp.]
MGVGYDLRVREAIAEALDEAERDLIEGFSLTPALREALRKIMEFASRKQWFHPRDHGHMVIAGMEEAKPFPVLLEYDIGTPAAGKLRYRKADEARVGEESHNTVAPFAQRDIMNSVIQDIHPRVYDPFVTAAARVSPEEFDDEPDPGDVQEREEAFSR